MPGHDDRDEIRDRLQQQFLMRLQDQNFLARMRAGRQPDSGPGTDVREGRQLGRIDRQNRREKF